MFTVILHVLEKALILEKVLLNVHTIYNKYSRILTLLTISQITNKLITKPPPCWFREHSPEDRQTVQTAYPRAKNHLSTHPSI